MYHIYIIHRYIYFSTVLISCGHAGWFTDPLTYYSDSRVDITNIPQTTKTGDCKIW